MGWYLHDGRAQLGPLDEQHVERMIAAGLPLETLAREEGADQWIGLRSHPAFALAIDRRMLAAATRPATLPPPPKRAPKVNPWIGAGVMVAVGCIILGGIAGRSSSPPKPATAVTAAPEPPPVVPAKPVESTNPYDVILTKHTVRDALAVARPMFVEKFGDTSPGSFLFSLWAIKNLRWVDVAVINDETTFARVQKDVDAEREKRLCVAGQIVQISAHKQPTGTLYDGLLISNSANVYHFAAVKSTGDLVANSSAHFCGIVTGLYDYPNSGGGTSHAIDMVGIFDLLENKK